MTIALQTPDPHAVSDEYGAVAIFEAVDRGHLEDPWASSRAFDALAALHGHSEARKLWSRACEEYDRRHMPLDDYCENYPCDD